MKHSAVARKLRGQIQHFSGIFYPRFSKPKTRFIAQMIYGIQASQDVKLSRIVRSLGEEILPKKTEERLSYHLGTQGMGEKINEIVAEHGARRVHKDTLIIIDPTDIKKSYAKRMPYLGKVRDGNTGELVNGYWMCAAVACERGGRRMVPLQQKLWSAEAPDFVSENYQMMKMIGTIQRATNKRGIYMMDRGGDRAEFINYFLHNELRFIIRLVGTRKLVFRGKQRVAAEIGRGCKRPYAETIVKEEKGREKTYHIEYGFRPVRMPGRREQLYLVVVKGIGEEPLLFLTNVDVKKNRRSVWFIVSSYFTRWLIEEVIRFLKQSYRLEDMRVLNYERLRNLVALVLAAAYFSAAWLGESLKLKILATRVAKAAKRFFGVPDFHYYALADGIAVLLTRLGKWGRKPHEVIHDWQRHQQLLFADA